MRLGPLLFLPHLLPAPPSATRFSRRLHMSARRSALVDPAWLASRLPSATVLDASWYKPPPARDARADFIREHIPGARRFDIDAPGLADATSPLPHMLPGGQEFAAAVRALGVRKGVPVVVYARDGLVASARAWWMFRAFGVEDVYVLQGGLAAWKAAGEGTEEGEVGEVKSEGEEGGGLEVREEPAFVKSMEGILKQIESGEGVIVDARSQGRFDGTEPEPRKGLRGGHMPGAVCLPASKCVDGQGKLKSVEQLEALFNAAAGGADVPSMAPVSLTCGSGVTAAVLCLALYELGVDASVYDGSWTEFGQYSDNPIVKSTSSTSNKPST